ncbi:LysE family translocator [Pseudomonas sp. TTU2014-080ASC]|uniref:LysE family translocator n=1 Tax=Pseudomonas sp. TTU2014-080ASC TaxID=1729724 RepID=UPI0007187460|nr:LysE family translocator [Pseudomonas sp. TTU2014-080ASC]KRW59562.1 lysine transporter LysE [Pseudomonas sp. TTU2014-080ASC]
MSLYLAMAAFALAMSVSPGPVNIVALSAGARFGVRASLRHVTGATVGFIVLFLLVGLGLHGVLQRWTFLTLVIQLAGVGFLLYIAWQLALDEGQLAPVEAVKGPTFLHGALMQWLNPKAWLASVSGMGAFVADGNVQMVLIFALIYFVICYASVAAWACAGGMLGRYLDQPAKVRVFNRCMAALLVVSAVYLLVPE